MRRLPIDIITALFRCLISFSVARYKKTTVIVIDCGGFLYPKTGAVGGSRIHSGLLRFVPLLLVAS